MRYLLDTNIIIYASKNKYPSIKEHMLSVPFYSIVLPTIVLGELEYGCRKSKDYERNASIYNMMTSPFEKIPFGEKAAKIYGEIRAILEQKGDIIGNNDLLIASIALAEGCVLVTNNVKEYRRVPGLVIEDWTI